KTLGQKTERGFYQYEGGHKLTPALYDNKTDLTLITNRLILRILNESMACWREKIVADSDLIDAGMIFGTGFAPFRGGPVHYAKQTGMAVIKEKLQALEAQFGNRFLPDPGWDLQLSAP